MEFNPAFKTQAIDPKAFLDQYLEGQRGRQMQEMERQRGRQMQEMETEFKKMPFLQAPPLEMTPNSNDRFMRSLMQEENPLSPGSRGFVPYY